MKNKGIVLFDAVQCTWHEACAGLECGWRSDGRHGGVPGGHHVGGDGAGAGRRGGGGGSFAGQLQRPLLLQRAPLAADGGRRDGLDGREEADATHR